MIRPALTMLAALALAAFTAVGLWALATDDDPHDWADYDTEGIA